MFRREPPRRHVPGENKIQAFDGWSGAGSALVLKPAGSFSCQEGCMGQFEVPPRCRPGPTAFAVLLALLVVAAPLRGQAGAPQDEVRYRDPDGTIKTISRAEHQSRVADLRRLIDDLNSNRMVLMTASGDTIPVSNERLHDIARWLAKQDPKKGGLTALEVPGWINDQIEKSRELIPTLTKQLAGLTSNPQPLLGATKIEWPVPMDWMKVKGTMPLHHYVVCQFTRALPLDEAARLDLQGNGEVILVLSPGTDNQASIPGGMIPQGIATGQGRRTLPTNPPHRGFVRWRVQFNRMNDDLVMTSYIVGFVPDQSGMTCETSRLEPR